MSSSRPAVSRCANARWDMRTRQLAPTAQANDLRIVTSRARLTPPLSIELNMEPRHRLKPASGGNEQ